jgi:hypothetical protein
MSLFVVLALIMLGIGFGAWLIGTTYDRVAKTEAWKRAMSTLTGAFSLSYLPSASVRKCCRTALPSWPVSV